MKFKLFIVVAAACTAWADVAWSAEIQVSDTRGIACEAASLIAKGETPAAEPIDAGASSSTSGR